MGKHLRIFMDSDLITHLQEMDKHGDDEECEKSWKCFWNQAHARALSLDPPAHHQPRDIALPLDAANCIQDAEEASRLLKSACLILGFHPDQATEPCIDLALWLRIPFAVCPCCVF